MKIIYISALAIASLMGTIVTSNSFVEANNAAVQNSIKTEQKVKACASKSNPCAAKNNPCASKSNPCAAKKNPCASKSNPCAAKNNPCASKSSPCAAKNNPCASKSNPCAAKKNPCASKSNPCAAKSAKYPNVYTENGVALDGQDVVAYFTQKRLAQGSKQFSHKWNGATWQFANASHRDLFAKNPEKYAPQYGGYCAKAASDGNLATTIANAWEVRNGKLYLNYSADAQQEWLQDTAKKIVKADQNYPKILSNETLFR